MAIQMFYVYILASQRNGTLYTGVTRDLLRPISEHKSREIQGFSQKYNVTKLVYFEETPNFQSAVNREKQLKKWNRKWKLELIEKVNPELRFRAAIKSAQGALPPMIIKPGVMPGLLF